MSMSHPSGQSMLHPRRTMHLTLVAALMLLLGCSVTPTPRLPLYLSEPVTGTDIALRQWEPPVQDRIHAALLVRWDSSFQEAAPPTSEDLFQSLVQRLRLHIETALPVKIVTVLEPDLLAPGGGSSHIIQIAQERTVPYLIVGILSSVEMDSPLSIPLSLESVYVVGTRTENYTLAELALLDGADGRVLLYAQGRGYMRLDRPDGEQQSNLYPVIQRSEGESPIYPEPARAEDALREVTGGKALGQALYLFSERWNRRAERSGG